MSVLKPSRLPLRVPEWCFPTAYCRTSHPKKSKPGDSASRVSRVWATRVLLGFISNPMSFSQPSNLLLACSIPSRVRYSSRVAKGHCCPSAPSEPDLSLSRHPAQAHHELHGFLFSSCLDCLGLSFLSVSSWSLKC